MQDNLKNHGQRGGIDICQLTDYYCPHTNFDHHEFIQKGEPFLTFNHRQVIWMLVKTANATEKNSEVTT